MKRRLKILVEAYECSPLRGHAAGSSWQIITRLSDLYDLWVITEFRYQKEVNEYFASGGTKGKNINFFYIQRDVKRGSKGYSSPVPILTILRYHKWLKRSYIVAMHLNEQIEFNFKSLRFTSLSDQTVNMAAYFERYGGYMTGFTNVKIPPNDKIIHKFLGAALLEGEKGMKIKYDNYPPLLLNFVKNNE